MEVVNVERTVGNASPKMADDLETTYVDLGAKLERQRRNDGVAISDIERVPWQLLPQERLHRR